MFEDDLSGLKVLVGEETWMNPQQVQETHAPLIEGLEFFNMLNQPVTIGTRSGMFFTIHRKHREPDVYDRRYGQYNVPTYSNRDKLNETTNNQEPKLIIRRRTRVNAYQTTVHTPMNVMGVDENERLQKKFTNQQVYQSGQGDVIQQFEFSEADFHGCVYLYIVSLDIIVVCGDTRGRDIRHPYSPESIMARNYYGYHIPEHMEKLNGTANSIGFGMNITLVCPTRDGVGERYININDVVYRVPVIFDINIKPGLYITHRGRTTRNTPAAGIETEYYPWEEEDKFPIGLYRTFMEAETKGSTEYRKFEHEQWKAENENQKLIQEREINALRHENRLLEEQLKSKQHDRTIREIERKEVADVTKWIPTIIAGVISIVTTIMTLYVRSK